MSVHFILFCLSAIFFYLVCGQKNCDKFKEENKTSIYFPDGIPGDLEVVYSSKVVVCCGNNIGLLDVKDHSPTVTYGPRKCGSSNKCERMAMIFVDVDLPPPVHTYLHWCVINVPASDFANGYSDQSESGVKLAKYVPPLSVQGGRRYTFCVYCQNCERESEPQDYYNPVTRHGMNITELQEKFALGNPLACNYYHLQGI